MPGQRRLRRSRLVAAAVVVVAVAAAVLLVAVGPGGAVATPAPPPAVHQVDGRPLVAFLGDSWTAGVGATGRHGYAVRTAELLDWGSANFGVGGSGYSVPGPHDSLYADRISSLAVIRPDVVVVQGSLNERRSRSSALRSAAASTLDRLRAALEPGTPVLVVGASYNPGTPDTTIDRINRAVAGAAAQAGLPFVNPATQDWTDPHDPALWADSIHPADRGHQLIADRLAPLLQALVRARVADRSPATVLG